MHIIVCTAPQNVLSVHCYVHATPKWSITIIIMQFTVIPLSYPSNNNI